MSLSFAQRRKDIIDNPRDIKEVFSAYPFLQKEKEVNNGSALKILRCLFQLLKEFQRIAHEPNFLRNSGKVWCDLFPKVLAQSKMNAEHSLQLRNILLTFPPDCKS